MRLGKQRHESKYLTVKYLYEEKQWSINWMCQHLKIFCAAYYKWLHRSVSKQEAENIKLAELIREYDECLVIFLDIGGWQAGSIISTISATVKTGFIEL